MKSFDVVVIGSGIVGASCALGLQQKGFSVALVDQNDFTQVLSKPVDAMPSMRVSAMNDASVQLLTKLGAWQKLGAERVTSILAMKIFYDVSELDFNAAEFGFSDLGFIAENDGVLAGILAQIMEAQVSLFCPVKIESVEREQDMWRITFKDQQGLQELRAGLLVVAQGAQASLRELLGVETEIQFYNQKALVVNLQSEKPHRFIAYQRFLPTGPLAFLPLFKANWSSIVWTLPSYLADEYVKLDSVQLTQKLTQVFPDLGMLSCLTQSAVFELSTLSAEQYFGDGFVLIGDSAHVVHPLAGQGVNMGLQDVASLLELLDLENFKKLRTLKQYQQQCKFRNDFLSRGFTVLNRLFQLESSVFKGILNFGLRKTHGLHGVKRQLVNIARGQS